ncbi:MAG TPA: hypothetical protein VH482_08980 [Thermomicrobiales bacterium]
MEGRRFDQIAELFAQRRLTRRRALAQTGAGLAAGAVGVAGFRSATAQDAAATPETPTNAEKVSYLFLQSFRSGSIAPKEGEPGTFTVTLEQGTGQTVYFADRPSRDVGAVSTGPFLGGLGFDADDPPNAALVMETAPGDTDIAVVELVNPVLADDGAGVTYDVHVLANWQGELDLGFSEAPTDLAQVAPSFGPAHLFIDDCRDDYVMCWVPGHPVLGKIGAMGFCWHWENLSCYPCEPYYHDPIPGNNALHNYWAGKCNAAFAECNGGCLATF